MDEYSCYWFGKRRTLLATDWLCVVKIVFGCHNFCLFLKLSKHKSLKKINEVDSIMNAKCGGKLL